MLIRCVAWKMSAHRRLPSRWALHRVHSRQIIQMRQSAPHLVPLSSWLQSQGQPSHPCTHDSHHVACIAHHQWLSGGTLPAAWPPLSPALQHPSPLASAALTGLSQVDSQACFYSSAQRHARGVAEVRPLLRRHLLRQYSIPSACICSAPLCFQITTGHCMSSAHDWTGRGLLGLKRYATCCLAGPSLLAPAPGLHASSSAEGRATPANVVDVMNCAARSVR